MNFIKKIFEGKGDGSVHQQFVRFGRGLFERRAVIVVKKTGKIKINTSFELTNDMVLFVFENVAKARVSGVIFARGEIPSLGKGISKKSLVEYNVDREMASSEIEEIAKKSYFMLLDCSANGISLTTKKKLPKPSAKSGKMNDKFCVLEADLKYLPKVTEEFLFDLKEKGAKKIEISHDYQINEIILPKGEKDPEKIRILAKRKGEIIRKTVADGQETVSKIAFAA